MSEAPERTVASMTAGHYNRQREHLVGNLRTLADDIERVSVRDNRKDLLPDFHSAVKDIEHKLTWGIANAGFGSLLDAAMEAHLAARGAGPYGET